MGTCRNVLCALCVGCQCWNFFVNVNVSWLTRVRILQFGTLYNMTWFEPKTIGFLSLYTSLVKHILDLKDKTYVLLVLMVIGGDWRSRKVFRFRITITKILIIRVNADLNIDVIIQSSQWNMILKGSWFHHFWTDLNLVFIVLTDCSRGVIVNEKWL